MNKRLVLLLMMFVASSLFGGCRRVAQVLLSDDDDFGPFLSGQTCPNIDAEPLPTFDPCDGVTCDGHGTCQVEDGVGVCSCDEGYEARGYHCWAAQDAPASWTVLVYMSADNNLEEFGMDDLIEMMEVGSTDSVNLIVLSDRSADYVVEDVGGIDDWTSSKLLRVEKGALTELDDLGELDMGDPANLADFIEFALTSYPADRYMIDFWNHGGAWYGFGWDEGDGNDELPLNEIALGLEEGLAAAGVDHFDVIGFDACLMATLAVAQTVQPYGHYLVASEELEPGHGWNYAAFQALVDDPTMDGAALGQAIVDAFADQAEAEGTENDITLSVVDLTRINTLFPALYDGIQLLLENVAAYSPDIVDALRDTPAYGAMIDPRQSYHSVDFWSLHDGIASLVPDFEGPYANLQAALEDMVIYNHAGAGMEGSTGLAVYFPRQCKYYDNAYDDVAGMSMWRAFIKGFWTDVSEDVTGPQFLNEGHIADLLFEEDNWMKVYGRLDPATVDDLYYTGFFFSVDTGEVELVMGEEAADYDPDLNVVSARWDTSAVTVGQEGVETSYAYYRLVPYTEDGLLELTIPFAYFEQGADADVTGWVDWQILVDPNTGDTVSDTFFLYGLDDDESQGVGELVPVDGAEFVPVVYVLDFDTPEDSGWYLFDVAPFSATDPLEFGFAYLPDDVSYWLYLSAEDVSGNMDLVWVEVENN